jgi:hypothetical protein
MFAQKNHISNAIKRYGFDIKFVKFKSFYCNIYKTLLKNGSNSICGESIPKFNLQFKY